MKRRVGSTMTYHCCGCGKGEQSKPIQPPPALGVYGLPDGWVLVPTPPSVLADDIFCPQCMALRSPSEGESK
jgi:hypothetical protein